MRSLSVLTFILLLCIADIGIGSCQESPTVLYNPSTGGIFFDDLESALGIGSFGLLMTSDHANLLPSNGVDLAIPGQSLPLPTSASRDGFFWLFQGPVNIPFGQPVFAGNIVAPGTDVSDLTLNFGGLGAGRPIVIIPEPATTPILLTFCLPAMVRRRRQSAAA